jgi:phospholipase D1/2
MKLRTRSSAKVKDWVAAINTARRLPEGWCHPHRFGSFAPPRGLTEDGSTVQWFIDGQSAFDSIASSIEQAKSEVSFQQFHYGFCRKLHCWPCHVK